MATYEKSLLLEMREITLSKRRDIYLWFPKKNLSKIIRHKEQM